MKNTINILLLGFTFLIFSCVTNQDISSSQKVRQKKESKLDPTIDLTTHLRSFPGLIVKGQGANARFTVRGINSFTGGTGPLILLDRAPVNSYYDVYSTVPVADIKKIEVLKNPNDIAIYGVRGANGVIKITTNFK